MINNKFRQALAGDASMFERPEGEDSIEPKRFVVISAEGTKTEPSYFDNLSLLLKDNHISLQFLVLEHEAGQNTPERLVEQLIECRNIQNKDLLSPTLQDIVSKEFPKQDLENILTANGKVRKEQKAKFQKLLLSYGIDIDFHRFLKRYDKHLDVFAVILDRDASSHSEDSLCNAYNLCTKEGFEFCLSNPCFEFWLFLHLQEEINLTDEESMKIRASSSYMKSVLSSKTHHSKKISKGKFQQYYAKAIPLAIQNAQRFATDFQTLLLNPGTNLGLFFAKLEGKYHFHFSDLLIQNGHFRSIMRTGEQTSESSKSSSGSQKRIIVMMRENPHITTAQLAAALQISTRAVAKHLKELRTQEKIRHQGPKSSGYWEVMEH